MATAKVRYRGLSDVREISQDHLKKVHNIQVEKDLVWDQSNNKTLELEMTPELEAILRNEGTFTISEVKDDGSEGSSVADADPSKADDSADAAVVLDTTTGQKSSRR